MKRLCWFILIVILSLPGCRGETNSSLVKVDPIAAEPAVPSASVVLHPVEILTEYCRACHAIGPQRFLVSKEKEINWDHLFTGVAPESKTLWAKQILKVLEWPTDSAPDQQAEVSPGKLFMPVGSKRNKLATAKIGNQSARTYLIETIRAELIKRGLD